MSEPVPTVTLTIDGHEVTVPKGTNLLEAARGQGTEICHFCYHPGLSIAASCRQCLVEIAGQPKLQPSCQFQCADGMKVQTGSPRVLEVRRQMLEFTLVNHPVDCPICDKAGECLLQKHYFEWDAKASRIDMDKVHKPKKVDLGPTIVLDAERCILCSRCIRVCDEVAGVHQLEFVQRGDHSELTVAEGQLLDNPYSLNTVDVCPVGALTSKDFRFAMRAWELYTTPSVCNGCATGCNVEVHHNEGKIHRLVPRASEVNQHWMCDEGRVTYKAVHEGRLVTPTIDGLPAAGDKAVAAAAARLQPLLDGDRGSVGVVFSAQFANEDNWVLGRLGHEFLGLGRAYIAGKAPVPERADKILRDADINPNTRGARAIAGSFGTAGQGDLVALAADLAGGRLRGLIVLGGDLELPADAIAAARKLDALVVISSHTGDLESAAHVALPAASWPEVNASITNRDGKVQRLRQAFAPGGKAIPAWEIIVRLARKLGATMEYPYPRAIFTELVEKVPAFAGAEWGKEAQLVQLRFANSRG
jgi:NADH-quinone oxidoreductase subunit G